MMTKGKKTGHGMTVILKNNSAGFLIKEPGNGGRNSLGDPDVCRVPKHSEVEARGEVFNNMTSFLAKNFVTFDKWTRAIKTHVKLVDVVGLQG